MDGSACMHIGDVCATLVEFHHIGARLWHGKVLEVLLFRGGGGGGGQGGGGRRPIK